MRAGRWYRRRACHWSVLAVLAGGVGGCGDPPTEVVFEVIEEVQFAASLNVDLSQMERLGNGVYRQDLVVGAGTSLEYGMEATIDYTGWIANGSEFGSEMGFVFTMGNSQVIRGIEEGLLGTRAGGTRRIIIPPNLGFAGVATATVPAGSVLVYVISLLEAGE